MKPEPIGYYCPVCGEHRVNPDAGHGVGFVSIYNQSAPRYRDGCVLKADAGVVQAPHGDGDD
jgi:hypothetical protein